jgi:hypothetical protein
MFVHAVYFWLKRDLGHEEKREFLRRLKALAKIESALSWFIGEPAETRREVIDHTWAWSMSGQLPTAAIGFTAFSILPGTWVS